MGEKGISTFNAANGDPTCSGKYKVGSLKDRHNELVVMKTEKADIACFNVDDCSFVEFKAKTGSTTDLTNDNEYVYVFEKKVISKLRTR